MYRGVSLTLAAEGHERRSTQVQMRLAPHGSGALQATLLRRHAQDRPWDERTVPLERWDADPLRAVLRLAMAQPKSTREGVPASRTGQALEATAALA